MQTRCQKTIIKNLVRLFAKRRPGRAATHTHNPNPMRVRVSKGCRITDLAANTNHWPAGTPRRGHHKTLRRRHTRPLHFQLRPLATPPAPAGPGPGPGAAAPTGSDGLAPAPNADTAGRPPPPPLPRKWPCGLTLPGTNDPRPLRLPPIPGAPVGTDVTLNAGDGGRR
jgi:hypothetical protein